MDRNHLSQARISEIVPAGLREPPPRRRIRRKREKEEEGVGFTPPLPLFGDGIPFFILAGSGLIIGLVCRFLNVLPRLMDSLIAASAIFLVIAGLLMVLLYEGDSQENREHQWLVRNGIVTIGTVTFAETLPRPDEFGSERTVLFTFRVREDEQTIEGKVQTVSGRLDSVNANVPVAILYDPAMPAKRHALYKMLNYTADALTAEKKK